ncbi:protein phosphatase [Pelistega indica]|uniref:Protein phosphatase n=1 Tax=Pelistega indica TaxID=1414851 RepID=V8FT59_9BURK|nr:MULTISPECIES: type VI secretion system-associated protein TagF [Pelistega]ETD66893.1 protein phosphatase [Pelistega indica]
MTLSIDQLISKLGWYGKLPAGGDFFQRRLPIDVVEWWHRWLEQGLIVIKSDEKNVRNFLHAPIWNFIIPANFGSRTVQLGCIAPSRDRVGRLYPLLCTLSIPPEAYHEEILLGSVRFYTNLGSALKSAVSHGCNPEQFERLVSAAHLSMTGMLPRATSEKPMDNAGDILSILNEGHEKPPIENLNHPELTWRDLNAVFRPEGSNSFWWTSQATGAAYKSFVHGGMPNMSLFNTLFS